MNITDEIIEYEEGRLSSERIVALFQELVDNGMAWTLQGSYGRTARAMIKAGLVHLKGVGYDDRI